MEEFYYGEYYNIDDIEIAIIRKFPSDKNLCVHGINMIKEYIPYATFDEENNWVTFTYGKDAAKVFKVLNESRIEDIKEQMEELQKKYETAINAQYTGEY